MAIIRGKINGLDYSIFFYNCTKNGNCTSICFSSAFQAKPSLETINSWNGRKRFAFGFLDKDGDAALGMDVDTARRISRRAMDPVFDRWSELLAAYARHVGFRS